MLGRSKPLCLKEIVWERYDRKRRSQILLVVEYAPDNLEGRTLSDAIGGSIVVFLGPLGDNVAVRDG